VHYLLLYEVIDDYVTKRAPFRDQHLALAREAVKEGELLLGGALAEPADGAVLLFRSQAAAEAFANADPYVHNGLITKWTVRQWNTVAGSLLNLASDVLK
jgi:uncharacterized protein YciI